MTKHYQHIKKPIIFIGTGRSGTTIISEIINRHPEIAFPSNYQARFPAFTPINRIRLIFDNPFWRIFGQKKQLNKVPFFNNKIFRPSEAYTMWDYLTGDKIDFSRSFLIDEKLPEKQLDFIRNYFNRMVKLQGKQRLALKVTGPSRIGFFLKIFPDAIFVNLKRNTIPTIHSFLKVDFWEQRGAKQLWWTGVYDEKEIAWAKQHAKNPLLLTAFQLQKIHEITAWEKERFQPDYLSIHYEDFVSQPEKTLQKIVQAANLKPYSFQQHLKKINIYNRNKKDADYFNAKELQQINSLFTKGIN